MQPRKVRVSLGTAACLGLTLLKMDCSPTTAYLQLHTEKRCFANCKFCSQARLASGRMERIARGFYPAFEAEVVLKRLKAAMEKFFGRVCLQTILYEGWSEDLLWFVERSPKPLTVSLPPQPEPFLEELRAAGAERVVIPLDAASEEVFENVKGSFFSWEGHWKGLRSALRVFGKGRVGTHLILGIGETELEVARTLQELKRLEVYVALFAYVPVLGNQLPFQEPELPYFRRLQVLHYLISRGLVDFSDLSFEGERIVDLGLKASQLKEIISSGKPFLATGCPSCNRPFATERPSKLYNFPRPPSEKEVERILGVWK